MKGERGMKRVAGVSERLLECAEEEFLEKGFQNASMREIARKANTSPRAIYTRFPNKEGLFDAIVSPVSEGLIQLYRNHGDVFWEKYGNMEEAAPFSFNDVAVYAESIYIDMIDYIYDHRSKFLLIQNSLDGSRHTVLIHELTNANLRHLLECRELKKVKETKTEIMMKVLHMLIYSFYAAVFEPLRHDMNRREARFYIETLCRFFSSGILRLLEE